VLAGGGCFCMGGIVFLALGRGVVLFGRFWGDERGSKAPSPHSKNIKSLNVIRRTTMRRNRFFAGEEPTLRMQCKISAGAPK